MTGIHHVTAIAGRADRNVDFYTRLLGLRLVKRTVNFDDPTTWHLYFGDEEGRPGTILTFFPWEHAAAGRRGIGETSETAFRVPAASMGYWLHRFVEKGVSHQSPARRFDAPVLRFTDPDGTSLALVGVAGAENEPAWDNGDVPAEHAVRGFHGVTLMLEQAAPTAAILTGVLGFAEAGNEEGVHRFQAEGVPFGGVVDIHEVGGFLPGRSGKGSVHHIAFRAADDAAQTAMARKLADEFRLWPTEQKDRQYFRSVYFREPGGVLFEIATDQPGFAVDEPLAALGSTLKLPPFLEPRRPGIEAALPPLEPEAAVAGAT
ncbi:ring-cleaving dioxygenase [Bauldia litoralis]|uniref:Glyoxalase family protein n=1 Tax=Bauldia litoralis TaxID=665467 RepID=A0A1G6CPJ9_9HYPH|nr:ring-cleaving dioxygenase [Bauldia litoralis]SDB34809.1 glyoxalase family protein [Bauldia litoralis]